MEMEREQFEAALDRVALAHGRKVRAAIDAAGGGTLRDWERAYDAEIAYMEVRTALVDALFGAPTRPPPPTTPSAAAREAA